MATLITIVVIDFGIAAAVTAIMRKRRAKAQQDADDQARANRAGGYDGRYGDAAPAGREELGGATGSRAAANAAEAARSQASATNAGLGGSGS
jgi:hypothetical protein